ncbi:actin-depolymerizing factor 2-like [Diadema antillarum]|uniref:actin-depolymerizing factor 2-like n=1 Tax=Diadema antillarum TaxID=105358 RepID=UPI003A89613D
MALSGVQVPKEIKDVADLQKSKKTHQYLVFELKAVKIDGKETNTWTLKSSSDRIPLPQQKEGEEKKRYVELDEFKAHYSAFVTKELTDDTIVFAMYDFDNLQQEGGKSALNRVAFQWCPDNLHAKKKMCFASSVEDLKKEVADNTPVICANEKEEVTFENVMKQLSRK